MLLDDQHMREIAKAARTKIPEGLGFCILVFPKDLSGLANYISNVQKDTAISAMDSVTNALKKPQAPPAIILPKMPEA